MAKAKKTEVRANTAELLGLDEYDLFIVSFSGGKDSLAMVLDLLERGVEKDRIQLWHQRIDGSESDGRLMDWNVTEAYCEAIAKVLGIRLLYQWKDKGFEGEMLREDATTKGVYFETQDGETKYVAPSKRGKAATRRKFPQVSADLSVRWCSSYLKIDVCTRAINNDPALKGKKLCVLTGERREESSNRARYAEVEAHKSNTKSRTVHQWRSVIDWTEQQVWDSIKRWSINPHPAYHLGFGRVSCMACIFGDKNQWATIRALDPKRFEKIAGYESEFDCTIKRKTTIVEEADKGAVYEQLATETQQAELSMSMAYPVELVTVDEWELPAGAFRTCGGPN